MDKRIKRSLTVEKISFVIPCYKSENLIDFVVEEINETMGILNIYDFEIIIVSDGSPDGVYQRIKALTKKYTNIKGLELSKNFGQHAALMAGYRFATGDYVVSLDDDGQTPANEANKLILKLKDGYDVVYGKYSSKKHSRFRNFGSMLNDYMVRILLGKPKGLYVSSYFACKKFVIDEILNYKNAYPYLIGLVLRVTKNITNVDVDHRKREIGKSGYTLKSLLKLWLNGFTAFSVKPLRIATLSGFIFAFVGFLLVFYIVIHKILNPNIAVGWSSLVATMLIIGGIQMLMIGLIGEYVGRIYISINKSPQYVIKEKVNIQYEKK